MQGAFRAGPWLVEPQLNLIDDGTRTTHLEPKVMCVLVYLAEHRDQVVAKQRLIQAVWPDTFVTDDVLTHAISELRRAFGDDARQPRFILTVPKGGYRLIAPVERALEPVDTAGAASEAAGEPSLATARTGRRRVPLVVAVVAVLMTSAVGGVRWWAARSEPGPRVGRSVRVTDLGRVAVPVPWTDGFPAVVTDGTRVYFTTNHGIGFVSRSGGDAGSLSVPREVCELCAVDDISPDGSLLLVRRWADVRGESPVWLFPTSGGAPRRLGGVVAHASTWLPGGQHVVFAHGTDLWATDRDGTHPRRIVGVPARAFWVRASPDGRWLRFTLRDPRTNSTSLWEATVDGTLLKEVLPGWNRPAAECCGNWTPDGRHFIFQATHDGMTGLWAFREKALASRGGGVTPVRLTAGPLGFHSPVASRDGRKVFAVGLQFRAEPVKYDLRSRAFEPLLPGVATSDLRFSRDGKWIADVSPAGVWRMKADGSERVQLVSPPMSVPGPFLNWSPDATRLAFPGKRPGSPWKIYIVSRDGGTPQQVIPDDRNETDPDWSPDGSSLVFGRMPDYMAETSTPKAIHIVDLETGQVSTVPGSEGLFSPHWSPDGRYIAAQPLTQGQLVLFDFASRQWRRLAARGAHNPTWSRDSRYVYAQDGEDIWRVRIRDGLIEDVVSSRDLKRRFFGFQLTSLAPDDSPVAAVYHGNNDVYAFDFEAP